MRECREIRARTTEWVDHELTEADCADVEAHLSRCPPCRAHAETERSASELVRARRSELMRAAQPAETLRGRCAAAAAAGRGRRRRRQRARIAVAATVVLVAGGWTLRVLTERSTTVLAAQLAADHIKCHAVEGNTAAIDADVVQQRLLTRYGFQTIVPPGSADGRLRLIGSRRCLTGEGTNAHILYRFNDRPVSLYLVPNDSRQAATVSVLGRQAYVWSRDNGTYVLVADRPTADLAKLAAHLQRATATSKRPQEANR